MTEKKSHIDLTVLLVVIVALAVMLALTMEVWMPHGR